ncbi:ATP-binding protein [Paenibacillus larvae]|uniref:ATP-binding protein n=1 Tax=Paenibacillus larvae TaxID=1464 RepID=UPI002E0DC1B6
MLLLAARIMAWESRPKKKLGEPFFTTKEKGTGLGLMMCHQIMEAHQGSMKIESQVGKGTRVELCLPVLPTSM